MVSVDVNYHVYLLSSVLRLLTPVMRPAVRYFGLSEFIIWTWRSGLYAYSLVGWTINAELSPKRYLRGPRSQEVVVVGRGGGEWGGYLTLHYHHLNDFCIEIGSDESRFNVLLTVRDKVARQCLH